MVDDDEQHHKHRRLATIVAVVLAVGMAVSLVIVTIAIAHAVYAGNLDNGLGENTTQVLIGWGGGIIGVLGAFIGYAFGRADR